MTTRVLVTGAGGFIGHHLVDLPQGHAATGCAASTSSCPEYTDDRRRRVRDPRPAPLGRLPAGDARGIDHVYALAADMGGMGFISAHHADDPAQQRADQPPHARGRPARTACRATSTRSSACIYPEHLQTRHRRHAARARRTPTRRSRRTRTAGRSSSASSSASTTRASTAWRPASSASTTSTARTARTTAAARRRRPRCAARSRSPRTAARSRSGATASRPARSATSTTASRASTGSCSPTTASRSTSAPTAWSRSTSSPAIVIEDRRQADIRSSTSTGPQGVRGRNSDNTRLREVLGWEPAIDLEEGLADDLPLDREAAGRARVTARARTPLAAVAAVIPRVDVLGVGISAIDIDRRPRRDRRAGSTHGEQHYVCVTGVHGVMESQRDPELLRIHNESGLTTPDGMPMVWAGHRAGATKMQRVYGPDLMLALCRTGRRAGWRMLLLRRQATRCSSSSGATCTERFPGFAIVGHVLAAVPAADPGGGRRGRRAGSTTSGADLVWVGLSTPKQERWMAAHVGRLTRPALLGVGAAFDIHAGNAPPGAALDAAVRARVALPPVSEPRRLWRRYLSNNPRFVWKIARTRPFLR